MGSGLYEDLVGDGLLVSHEERPLDLAATTSAYRVIEPRPVPFISHPYEWAFGQLRDAALTTIEIQKRALDRGLTLKDASAFNIQFEGSRPVLIDSLSFERYREGTPWVAYRQFCQHFLAPLALMAYLDVRLVRLFERYIDGIPLDLTSTLLPARTRLRPSLLFHIHLHARSISRYGDRPASAEVASKRVSKTGLLGLLSSLEGATRKLSWNPRRTEWHDYETSHAYGDESRNHKERIVEEYLSAIGPRVVWDLGANTGAFSRIAARAGARVIALDDDAGAVELLYEQMKAEGETAILPLYIDLSNPSPSLGWAHRERRSLVERASGDAVLALALVHHLAIGNNVPLPRVAEFLASLAPHLLVEFVPKSDPQAGRLLAAREDVFPDYHRDGFEMAFAEHYDIIDGRDVTGTERRIYRMTTRDHEN